MEAAAAVKNLIERERTVCTELAEVLHAERDALTRFSADDVTECVRRKDGLHAQLSALASERRRAVENLGRALGVGGGDGRVTSLLPGLSPVTAAELRHAVAGLRRILLETRRLQRVNGVLADASLRMVGELLRAYRQLLPGTRYDGRAMVTPGPAPDALDQRV